MVLNKLFVFLTSGTGKINGFVNEDNGGSSNRFFNKEVTGHLQFSPTINFLKGAHTIFQIIDWVSIIFLIIGLLVVSSSQLGNNGKWKKSGYRLIIVGYAWIIGYHSLALAAPSFGNFSDGKLWIFIMMLLGQILMYVASSVMYTIGSHDMELYEMAGNPSNDRQKISSYNSMLMVLIAGAVCYFIAGLV